MIGFFAAHFLFIQDALKSADFFIIIFRGEKQQWQQSTNIIKHHVNENSERKITFKFDVLEDIQ